MKTKVITPAVNENGDTIFDEHEKKNEEIKKQTLSKKEWVELHKNMVADIYATQVPEDAKFFETDGTILIVHFERLPNVPEKAERLKTFFCKKPSFNENLKMIADYLNYFCYKFDKENILVSAYARIKYYLDIRKVFTPDNPDGLVQIIYDTIFVPEIVEGIKEMVEINYLDDIERDSEKYRKNSTTGKEYLESLEFTNEHYKILLAISMGMKIIYPVMYHYFLTSTPQIRPTAILDRGISVVYYFYEGLFPLFQGDCNMFNKLHVYVKRKVVESEYHNKLMFRHHEILGDDVSLVIEKFVKNRLITDNMIKYKFNKELIVSTGKYRENIIGFNKAVIKFQLTYFIKEVYEKNLSEMSRQKNPDGLSAADKMEMNLAKVDRGIVDLAKINVANVMDQINDEAEGVISDDELQFYMDNWMPTKTQVMLVRSSYAPRFISYRDEAMISKSEFTKMALLLVKRLCIGNVLTEKESEKYHYLPMMLLANPLGNYNKKATRTKIMDDKLGSDDRYLELINGKYRRLEQLHPGIVRDVVNSFVNQQFTFNIFGEDELNGKKVLLGETEQCQLINEVLHLLQDI